MAGTHQHCLFCTQQPGSSLHTQHSEQGLFYRLHTLSDEELLSLLEQMQSNSFPAQVLLPHREHAKPHLTGSTDLPQASQQNTSPTLSSSAQQGPDRTMSMSSEMQQLHPQGLSSSQRRASQTAPNEPTTEQTQPQMSSAQESSEPVDVPDQAATEQKGNAFGDWKHQLQALAKPLMQQMPGEQSCIDSGGCASLRDHSSGLL